VPLYVLGNKNPRECLELRMSKSPRTYAFTRGEKALTTFMYIYIQKAKLFLNLNIYKNLEMILYVIRYYYITIKTMLFW
jgi:hypothetical protein